MLSKIGFLTYSCSDFVPSSIGAPFFSVSGSLPTLYFISSSPTLALFFMEGGEAGRQKQEESGAHWRSSLAAWEGVGSTYSLVPFEGVPQFTKDGLVAMAGPRLRKEDN